MKTRSTVTPLRHLTVRHSYENSLTVPRQLGAGQRIGYLYSEGEIIYLADTPLSGYSIFNVRLASARP